MPDFGDGTGFPATALWFGRILSQTLANFSLALLALRLNTPQQMRRKEREQGVAAVPSAELASFPAPEEDAIKEENSSVKMGAEAFVAKRNGSNGYGQPEWESDETLEAYLSS